MANRTGRGQWQKGVSGNPTGRPKLPAEVKEMFQAKAPEAFEVLCRHLNSKDPRVSVAAGDADSRSGLRTASAVDRRQHQ
jgi:hypothetical protein